MCEYVRRSKFSRRPKLKKKKRMKSDGLKFVDLCPFDDKPCDTPVPRGYTACPECPRFGRV